MGRIHGVEDILLGFGPKDAGSIPAGSVPFCKKLLDLGLCGNAQKYLNAQRKFNLPTVAARRRADGHLLLLRHRISKMLPGHFSVSATTLAMAASPASRYFLTKILGMLKECIFIEPLCSVFKNKKIPEFGNIRLYFILSDHMPASSAAEHADHGQQEKYGNYTDCDRGEKTPVRTLFKNEGYHGSRIADRELFLK